MTHWVSGCRTQSSIGTSCIIMSICFPMASVSLPQKHVTFRVTSGGEVISVPGPSQRARRAYSASTLKALCRLWPSLNPCIRDLSRA